MGDVTDEETQPTRPVRTALRTVEPRSELEVVAGKIEDLKSDLASMQRGYHGVLQTTGRLEVLATRIHAQLSTIKMTREIAEVGVAGAALLVALCFAVFTVRHFGLWVGWWS